MPEPRPTRPPLATVVCIYEVIVAFVSLPIAWIFIFGFFHSAPLHHSVLPSSVLQWVSCALAIAGAIALWQMRRAAFFLFATRFGFLLFVWIIRLPHAIAISSQLRARLPTVVTDSIVVKVGGWLILVQWIIGALIVWYVYKVTRFESPLPPIPESQASAA